MYVGRSINVNKTFWATKSYCFKVKEDVISETYLRPLHVFLYMENMAIIILYIPVLNKTL